MQTQTTQPELFAPAVHCAHCGKPTYTPKIAVRHIGLSTAQFAFCNDDHANKFYLKRLRESGL